MIIINIHINIIKSSKKVKGDKIHLEITEKSLSAYMCTHLKCCYVAQSLIQSIYLNTIS